ncbi:MAG: PH domain-containing protein [Planctomycetales bacterium]|nr:PH domain-containing protein [Planctomycetales bacterium]MCA9167500.1 PH domain-containing protein [Planctomycetales bacterium]
MSERCGQCDAELVPEAMFCHECGAARIDSRAIQPPRRTRAAHGRDDDLGDRIVGSASRRRRRRRSWQPGIPVEDDDTELEMWSDTFSAKGLINFWLPAILLTIAAPFVISAMQFTQDGVRAAYAALGLLWGGLVVWLVFLKLNDYYILTSQRFVHKEGILTRHTRRIEVIDIDDISYRQGILERLVGVGTIEIISSDKTDPVFELNGIDRVHDVAELMDEARRKERIRRGLHIESV